MSQSKLLSDVIRVLETAAVPVMVTGSLASSLQGEPRSSHDIDLVIQIRPDQIHFLISEFTSPNFYLSRDAIMEAISQERMFNLLDLRTGDKVDFWILTDSPFDTSRFHRKQPRVIDGLSVDVSSPEDTILAKLAWCQASGGSEKQFQDSLRVYELQYSWLDQEYLNQWSKELEVEALLRKLRSVAEPLK
ncbi:hypothetical protein SH661x_004544 [Planctomicrobium sp. SH661]|uniref:hypothetical protein n=1 Tax=Planctomicrobium sp. SH661 TaxID=3448124 RepID=UPI003F5BEF56